MTTTTETKMRALVVDDEPLAGRRLARQLERLGVEVTAILESGTEAVARPPAFDVAFLDIQMPGLNGLETAAQLTRVTDAAIVFVTAYDEHALAAFDVGAIDYVLKPITASRLARTLDRLGAVPPKTESSELVAASNRLAHPPLTSERPSAVRLEVKSGLKTRYIDAMQIQRLYAADKYVMFMDAEGTQHVLDESLAQLEIKLAPLGFVRVHRRELIRLDAVTEISKHERSTVAVLKSGEHALVSRRLSSKLKSLLSGDGAPDAE